MGTHPIFESDFDCLTDCPSKRREWAKEKEQSRKVLSCNLANFLVKMLEIQSTLVEKLLKCHLLQRQLHLKSILLSFHQIHHLRQLYPISLMILKSDKFGNFLVT